MSPKEHYSCFHFLFFVLVLALLVLDMSVCAWILSSTKAKYDNAARKAALRTYEDTRSKPGAVNFISLHNRSESHLQSTSRASINQHYKSNPFTFPESYTSLDAIQRYTSSSTHSPQSIAHSSRIQKRRLAVLFWNWFYYLHITATVVFKSTQSDRKVAMQSSSYFTFWLSLHFLSPFIPLYSPASLCADHMNCE